MRAVVYDGFGQQPEVREVADPRAPSSGAVIRVLATGLCRSDWHGWMGHDADITTFPHVPGHELAGVVASVGHDVTQWQPGDRVTTPFVSACGDCASCRAGNGQVCERQTQPGFTHWGSFAELVAIEHADVNLVRLPDDMPMPAAASLGCRFATAYRAVVAQGRAREGEHVVVWGCGGIGLAAIMVARAHGAHIIGVGLTAEELALASDLGADVAIDATAGNAPEEIRAATSGGAHLSIDAVGDPAVCAASIESLRRRGRHVQVGLLPSADGRTPVPMGRVIAWELELRGAHGMAAVDYAPMLDLIAAGTLQPGRVVTRRIGLDAVPAALTADRFPAGVTIIEPYD